MAELTILTWNIRQGGRKAIEKITTALIDRRADVIVITEYKENDAGAYLRGVLQKEEWHYIESTEPPVDQNGILIASVYPVQSHGVPFSTENGAHRWHEVYMPDWDIFLLGVHVPNVNETYDKQYFWEQIMHYANSRDNARALIAGDFNTARRDEKNRAPRKYSDFIMALMEKGWTDAWKEKHSIDLDYSWYSHRQNGYRLDYIFLSPALADKLTWCAFFHHEREQNYSDHSMLVATLA